MNNFFDLRATDYSIEIAMVVEPTAMGQIQVWLNQQCIYDKQIRQPVHLRTEVPVLAPIEIRVQHQDAYVRSLKFDNWESRPQHGIESPGEWRFSTNGCAFYVWKHTAAGHGWLLKPQM